MSTDLEQRVAKGAALLDAYKPGWFKDIDLSRLDQANGVRCVLGQTYGTYIKGMETLFGSNWRTFDAVAHGFNSAMHHDDDTVEWTRVIQQRKQNTSPSYSVSPEVAITPANIEAAKDILREFTLLSPTYAGDLTDTGVLYTLLDALGVLPLVKA